MREQGISDFEAPGYEAERKCASCRNRPKPTRIESNRPPVFGGVFGSHHGDADDCSLRDVFRGDGGTRTRDFLLAKQVLYQLSYVPLA